MQTNVFIICIGSIAQVSHIFTSLIQQLRQSFFVHYIFAIVLYIILLMIDILLQQNMIRKNISWIFSPIDGDRWVSVTFDLWRSNKSSSD